MPPRLISIFCVTLAISFVSCNNLREEEFSETVRIRLDQEPDRLHPMLSTQAQATQVERWIFSSVQEYNPESLELLPLLIESRPKVNQIEDELVFEFRFRDEAAWPDGSMLTGYDYLYTMKSALVPNVQNSSWRNFIKLIGDIAIDEADPKRVEVRMGDGYMQAEEIVTGFPVYPEYVYDPDKILRAYSFEQLHAESVEEDSTLLRFAEHLNAPAFSNSKVVGSGAYQLVSWEAQQSLILEKKENWWGEKLGEVHPLLQARPQRIIYYIMPDEQTALTSLKDQALDIVSDISPEQFRLLRESKEVNLDLFSPAVLQYFYIPYNTAKPALADARTRRALSQLMDLETVIEELFLNEAQAVIGPIHPSKSYYRTDLLPLPYNPEAAQALLHEAGWGDQDNDGVLDQTIRGQRVELSLEIYTTRSKLSQDVATVFKQAAAEVGIEIEIVPRDVRQMIQDVRAGNFDMACLASRPPAGDLDPYSAWHSDNVGMTGNNLTNFADDRLDQIIADLRQTRSDKERARHFQNFQQILYDEQPALFLVAPRNRIAVNPDMQIMTGALRPGYFENTMTTK